MKKIKVISCSITIMIMALIFFFSSQTGEESSEVSNGLLFRIIEIFFGNLSEVKKEEIFFASCVLIRKTAHFAIYAMLGASLMLTVKSFIAANNINTVKYAMIIGILYAVSDELHQGAVSGRDARITDVVIDSLGVLFGVLMFSFARYVLKMFIRKKRRAI